MEEKRNDITNKDEYEYEKIVIHNIEKFGFHIASLEDDGYIPAFVFSIGFYKTYNHPEIIIFGLKPDVLQGLLHKIGSELKNGMRIKTDIDYDGIVANYPVRFLKVHHEFYKDYLGFAGWYYDKSFDFPVYQLVWTDKKGKFPWEDSFFENWKFKQPLLDRNTDFKFFEERNLGVYTTQATLNGNDILRVYHNEDGDWQFHSEEYPNIENSRIVCLEDLVKKDPSLNEIHYLNYGQYALRKDINSDWEIFDSEEE